MKVTEPLKITRWPRKISRACSLPIRAINSAVQGRYFYQYLQSNGDLLFVLKGGLFFPNGMENDNNLGMAKVMRNQITLLSGSGYKRGDFVDIYLLDENSFMIKKVSVMGIEK